MIESIRRVTGKSLVNNTLRCLTVAKGPIEVIKENLEVPNRKFADYSRVGWGYTYFVRRDDLIKIGFSGAPKQRISSLGGRLYILAIVPNTIIDEPTAHKKFAHLRVTGEWFQAAPDLLEFIKQVKAEADKMPKREYPTDKLIEQRRQITDAQHHLARLRPGHPAAHHISNLIQQLKNYPLNPDALRPAIRRSIERIEQSRSGRQGEER